MDHLLAVVRPRLEQRAGAWAAPGDPGESTADLVQEAVLRVWEKLDQFRGGPDEEQTTALFHAWLDQIVRHLGQDRKRRQHAQRRPPAGKRLPLASPGQSSDEAVGVEPPAGEPTPSADARSTEEARLVQEALARIADPGDREIVRLCFFEGLSLRQIAQRRGISYDKVRERYHCALRGLERELGGLL